MTRSFDFGENKYSEEECMALLLEAAAALWPCTLAILKAPTPTDRQIKEVLDFFGPFGSAEACWRASRLLEVGRYGEGDDDDFDMIEGRVRQQCRRMLASGRVKAAGQARQRHPKSIPLGQGDLFCEGEVI